MNAEPNTSPTRRARTALVLGVGAAIAAIAAIAVVRGNTNDATVPERELTKPVSAEPAAPAKPGGVITFEVTGKGLFTATGSGKLMGATTREALHAEGQVASPVESAPSPDGKLVASVVRDETGVFLSITGADGSRRSLTQVAASSDPQLVAGGKGHARAVEGVPLVVAWSPDSSMLAFGSVTGAPYFLGIMGNPSSTFPGLSYAEVSGGYVGELAWSPDGSRLAISTYSLDRTEHSVLVAQRPGSSMFVSRLADGCHITWSPDGEYVAVHRDPGAESGAWVISAGNFADRWAISREMQAFPLTWREG